MKKQLLTLSAALLALAMVTGCDDGVTGSDDPVPNKLTEQEDEAPVHDFYSISEPSGLNMGPTGKYALEPKTGK